MKFIRSWLHYKHNTNQRDNNGRDPMNTNLLLSTIEDKKVIKSGDRKNIETTVDKGKLANATKKKYMAITKHIPLIANKITVRRGRSKTF